MLNWPKKIDGEIPEVSAARVFAWANSIYVWTPDIDEWHIPEHWPLRSELEEHAIANDGLVLDDCDGFMSLCRYALWNLDVPNRLIACNEPTHPAQNDGNHAVLTVEGTGLVIDNMQVRVVPRQELEQLGYQWVSLSGLNPGDPWTEIKK